MIERGGEKGRGKGNKKREIKFPGGGPQKQLGDDGGDPAGLGVKKRFFLAGGVGLGGGGGGGGGGGRGGGGGVEGAA